MNLFLQPILHLVWSVNSVGSGVTLRACGLLLETRRVLTHTVLLQNLFIFSVFLKFDFVCSELAAFSWNSVVSSPTEEAVLLGKALALAFLAFKGR